METNSNANRSSENQTESLNLNTQQTRNDHHTLQGTQPNSESTAIGKRYLVEFERLLYQIRDISDDEFESYLERMGLLDSGSSRNNAPGELKGQRVDKQVYIFYLSFIKTVYMCLLLCIPNLLCLDKICFSHW